MSNTYRAEFDLPREVCYLNACYMAVQPRRVIEAAKRGAEQRARPWNLVADHFFDNVEKLRSAYARQLGCKPDNIAIVPSAGYGVACAALNLPLGPGDVVLSMRDQFPSNHYAWRRKASAVGAEMVAVTRQPGLSWADSFLEEIEHLGMRIRVATLEWHHWASAETIDLHRVVPALRKVGARVVLDLTQTVGAMPVDVTRLAPDFMVTAGYKWQFSPYGVGFLYVDEQHFDGIPIEEAWMGRDGAEDFSRLSDFTERYQPGARRFDVSEKSSFSNIAGALEALQTVAEWGIETICETLAATNEQLAEMLRSHGFETADASDRAPHFQAALLPDADPRVLASELVKHGVYASVRGDHLRVAPHLYTDEADIAHFDQALGAALERAA